MTRAVPNKVGGILSGELPAQTKEDIRIAAKRERDRKRYAEKTQLNWNKNDSNSDRGSGDVL